MSALFQEDESISDSEDGDFDDDIFGFLLDDPNFLDDHNNHSRSEGVQFLGTVIRQHEDGTYSMDMEERIKIACDKLG